MNATPPGTEAKNGICLDVGSNPKLKDFFSRLPDGEETTLEITFIKTGMTNSEVHGSVKSMAAEGMEEDSKPSGDEKPGGEVKPNAEESLMVSIGGPKSEY